MNETEMNKDKKENLNVQIIKNRRAYSHSYKKIIFLFMSMES